MTNHFTQFLRQSADEVREYQRNSPNAHTYGDNWLESLIRRLEHASTLNDGVALEREVDAIACSIIDSGPLTSEFVPSFEIVLGALQSRRKKLAKKQRKL